MEKTVILLQSQDRVNADLMTDEEILLKLRNGLDDMENGKVQEATVAFADFKERHQ